MMNRLNGMLISRLTLIKYMFVFFLFVSAENCFAAYPQNSFTGRNSIIAGKSSQDRWIAVDKYKHFIVSAFLMGISYNIARNEGSMTRKDAIYLGCGFSFSLGIAKEWRDARTKSGHTSLKDLFVDVLGIGLGVLCFTDHLTF